MTKKIDTSFAAKSLGVSILLIALLLLPLFFYSCKETSTGPTTSNKPSPAAVSGKVYGKLISGTVLRFIGGVTVTLQAQGDTTKQSYTYGNTDSMYHFTVAFSDSPATKSVTLTLAHGGFGTKTTAYNVLAGQNITTWRDTLADTTSLPQPGQGSGSAANLVFISSTSSYANVHGAGGIETAIFTFEARDSLGVSVDVLHQAKVRFQLIDSTGGGEFLTPLLDSTGTTGGRHGRVWTTLNVGNHTGIAQVQALLTNKPSISATAPAFPIYGGPADLAHFSLGVDKMNFPALGLIGVQNKISVQIGDKWGNPVRKGTQVLFGTSAGVIQALDSTDDIGQAQVILTSGNPQPPNGYDIVTATTTGGDSSKILQKPVVILWSGPAIIDSVKGTDTSFTVRSNGALGVTYRVYDQKSHPLAQGTQITVTVVGDGASHLATSGDLSAILPDTQDSTYTKFHIQIQDTSGAPAAVDKPFFIVINVTGPNGTAQKILPGTLRGAQGGPGTVGKPASIVLASVSPGQISVKGSGGPASAVVTFLVLDRNGHSVPQGSALVKFRLSLLAGVTLFPDTIRTDVLGRVQTTITSGTQAGVVQVVASTDTGGGNFISSSPVPITVAGGLPDAAHFTLAVEKFNVPGLVVAGLTDIITAYVGDKYANPVQDNTAVYFTTSGGITTPTGLTKGGSTSSTLITGNPNPVGGIDSVTATTINKDSVKITGIARVIFSGHPSIQSVDTVVINDGATVPVNFWVKDKENGNPLSAGTTITAALQGDQSVTNQLQFTGDLSTTLGDQFSGGAHITDFSVTIRDTGVGDLNQGSFKLIISVNGPNGSTAKNVVGILKPSAAPIIQRIALVSAGDRRLSVKNAPAPAIDSSIFVFEIQDNLGRAISVKNVPIDFLLTGAPGTFSPPRQFTDSFGNAKTIFYSGTDTGSVSIQAEYGSILSAPQNLIILPGPASAVRLSLTRPPDSTKKVNFPGAVFTSSDKIGEAHAIVTDLYGNPVAIGTEVDFSSNGGHINPSGYTNSGGLAIVDWYGGAPTGAAGIVTVKAKVGSLADSATVVYSNAPQVSIAALPNPLRSGIDTIITFRVKDVNGNPLAQGTTIHLGVSGSASNYVLVSGDTTLPDTKDTAYTYINYHVRDTNTVILDNRNLSFTLSVSGLNGSKQLTVNGSIQGAVPPSFSVLALVGMSANNLSVKGVGQPDTSTTLTYELQDSSHRTIRTSGVPVLFRFFGVAGRFDSSTAMTDANGHARNTFHSDVIAETAKVQAVAKGIPSTLQNIFVQGGPPYKDFFTFRLIRPPDSLAKVNFPGGFQVGQDIGEAIVQVRDRYGNIVPIGTPIKFTSTGGVITGTAYTDQDGAVAASWRGGSPIPLHGIAKVVASAQGDPGLVGDSAQVIYSGQARILGGISGSLNMRHGIDTTVSYTVQDDSLNPLAQGTTIQVSVIGDGSNSLVLSGDKSITLSDTKLTGTGITSFKFRLRDTSTATFTPLQASVMIQVSGPNGTATQATADTLQGAPVPNVWRIALTSPLAPQQLTVKGGGSETVLLSYQVQDSLGNSIPKAGVKVFFSNIRVPGSFTPDTTVTDKNGLAQTAFHSDTVAGIAMVYAQLIGQAIQSGLTQVVIVGGPPDQKHFTVKLVDASSNPVTVCPSLTNFAGGVCKENEVGRVGVLAGDKYANPVPAGTSIYFTANAGVVVGSATTDATGIAIVSWYCGNPLPPGGIAVVTASAAGQSGTVRDSTIAVWSGQAIVSGGLASNFIFRLGIDTTITYKVADANGNPIASGNTIQVSVSATSAPVLSGNVNVTMPDTRDTNATKFSFHIKDTNTVITGQRSLTVTIQVSGPNGRATQQVNGTLQGTIVVPPTLAAVGRVALVSASTLQLTVQGGGGAETSLLTFEIQDSLGNPVPKDSVQIAFIDSGVVGSFSPTTALTDNNGQVQTLFRSGTTAGIARVSAKTVASNIVASFTNILIVGGKPALQFTTFILTPYDGTLQQVNFAGAVASAGQPIGEAHVQLGDKYGNPVSQGTPVYFATNAGVIQGSAVADANGFAKVTWYGGNPIPAQELAIVTLTAVGDNGQYTVSDTVLYSGQGLISGNLPANFVLRSGIDTVITYKVADASGNPLASGSAIQVSESGTSAPVLSGNINVTMPDTRNVNAAKFSFEIKDTNTVITGQRSLTVSIQVNGPNGTATQSVSGIVQGILQSGGRTRLPGSVALLTTTPTDLQVIGTGGTETSSLLFEIRDSLGVPVDSSYRVRFTLNNAPSGTFISPDSGFSDPTTGHIGATVHSGTVAGVVQVVATVVSPTTLITSTPVLIVVHAGLPDQAHFSINTSKLNVAGQDIDGNTATIGVIVGDKYANPVAEHTAVYFTTSIGIVTASTFTNAQGEGAATLLSGNPRNKALVTPPPGFGYVYAKSTGINGVIIQDSVYILFSGDPQLGNLNPATPFAVPKGGESGPITFTLQDENGNPLAAGTQISVTLQYTPPPNATGISVVATGDVSVTLGDTQQNGPGITQFSFRIIDQSNGGMPSKVSATILIHATSPNGNPADIQLSGTIG
ncbi:MAG: hypothetical protein ABSF91_06415 [Bacteroidota bacterium]|jgi:hypothetical protein